MLQVARLGLIVVCCTLGLLSERGSYRLRLLGEGVPQKFLQFLLDEEAVSSI